MALVRFYLPNGKGWRRGELLEIWHRFVEWLRLYNELVALTWGIAQLSYLCQRRLSWQNVSRGKLRSQKRLESFDRTNNGKVEAVVSNNLYELRCCMGSYEPNLSPRTGSRSQSRKGMSVRYWTILNLFEGSKNMQASKRANKCLAKLKHWQSNSTALRTIGWITKYYERQRHHTDTRQASRVTSRKWILCDTVRQSRLC